MKTISLLGAIFLPGAYLAAVFSMTFFNFNPDPNQPVISPQFWIYWAFTIPITTVIVGGWWFWERKRERKYGKEDEDLENGSEDMEKNIMAMMRRRTMRYVFCQAFLFTFEVVEGLLKLCLATKLPSLVSRRLSCAFGMEMLTLRTFAVRLVLGIPKGIEWWGGVL